MDSFHGYEQVIEHKSIDRISYVPIDIQHHILSFVDFTDVMNISTLSNKWRLIWASVTCINLSFRDFCDQRHFLNNSYDEYLSSFWAFVKGSFIKREAPVQKIQLKCDYFNCHQLNSLFVLCTMNNVQELELIAGHGIIHCPFRCHVLKLDEGFKNNICNDVQWKYFRVFGGLKTLHLVRVQLFDAYITEYLFSNCGVLENLSLENCCFFMTKFLNISANKLRKLNFVNMRTARWEHKCIFEGDLKLHTPNLVSLSYEGQAIHLLEFSDMVFLKHASIIAYCHSTGLFPELGAMVFGIQHVEELSVSADFVLCLSPAFGRPGLNFSPFGHLRWLKLVLQNTVHHIEGLIKLLQLSPNLEVLRIEFYQKWIDRWKWTEINVGFLSNNLKVIEIVAWHDSPISLELIKFFLQNAKFLEKIKFTQKLEKVDPERFYSLQGVKLASEEVSVSVASISASGKTTLFEIVYGKSGTSVQTKTSIMKIRMRRSMRQWLFFGKRDNQLKRFRANTHTSSLSSN